ncbi:uncharacterized protein PG986_004023 [Apiospora aurea]|uniref:Uncharacterized protein n=1 Tax=Apiospora aurea TaxID=335848 RepID=A0ABR1QMZ5_9PEZI
MVSVQADVVCIIRGLEHTDIEYIRINSYGVYDKDTEDPHPTYGTTYGTRGDEARKRLDGQITTDIPSGTYHKQLQIPETIEDSALGQHDQRSWSALDWTDLISHEPKDHSGLEPQSGSRTTASPGASLPSNEGWMEQSTIVGSEALPKALVQFDTKGGAVGASEPSERPDESLPDFKDTTSSRWDLEEATVTIEESRPAASRTERPKRYEKPVIVQRPYVLTQDASYRRNRDRSVVYHQQREDRELKKHRIFFKPKGIGSLNPLIIHGDGGNEIPPSRVRVSTEQMRDENRNHHQDTRSVDRRDEKTSQAFVDPYQSIGANPPQPVNQDSLSSFNPEPHVLVHSETGSTPDEPAHFLSRMLVKWYHFSSYTIWEILFEWYHSGSKLLWPRQCGKPLYVDVSPNEADAAVSYAQHISRPASVSISSVTSSRASAGTSLQSSPSQPAYSETSAEENTSSPTTTRPIVGANVPRLPPGTKLFLLMCVNTGPYQIKLAQVELTNVGNDETLFRRIREEYKAMRGTLMRNPFRIARKVEYVKFGLIRRHKSGECVGNYQTNSIPTLKEVIQREYAFSPCPPLIGPMPIQSHLFMHSFLNPGDHSGSMAVGQLPKKVGRKLRCTGLTGQLSDPSTMPFGWGIYIVEGLNTTLVVWLLGAGLLFVFLLTAVWTTVNDDVQSGMGIGQFALAFLALLLTTAAVKESNTLPAFG